MPAVRRGLPGVREALPQDQRLPAAVDPRRQAERATNRRGRPARRLKAMILTPPQTPSTEPGTLLTTLAASPPLSMQRILQGTRKPNLVPHHPVGRKFGVSSLLLVHKDLLHAAPIWVVRKLPIVPRMRQYGTPRQPECSASNQGPEAFSLLATDSAQSQPPRLPLLPRSLVGYHPDWRHRRSKRRSSLRTIYPHER
jgi:hypothetical protein